MSVNIHNYKHDKYVLIAYFEVFLNIYNLKKCLMAKTRGGEGIRVLHNPNPVGLTPCVVFCYLFTTK